MTATASDNYPDMYQIALLIDQIKHDDIQIRLNAHNHLIDIARALGPDRTREELIPFLGDSIDDDDDILKAIAEKLGELSSFVGGDEYVYKLLEPLQILATVEEGIVRDEAIKSIETIALKMPDEHLVKYYVPFVIKLGSNEWHSSRISAVALFHTVYLRLSEEHRVKFKDLFIKLCNDDTPMVRRLAAQYIGQFTSCLKLLELNEFVNIFHKLASDDQDSVRIHAISYSISFINALSIDIRVKSMLPIINDIASDRSWRIRWSFSNKIYDIANSLGDGVSNDTVANLFENLLNDTESEVRAAAAAQVSKVCSLLRKDIVLLKIMPSIKHLASDSSEYVRSSLASTISYMTPILGKDDTIEHLLPILLLLLRDENSDVRLSMVSNLGVINTTIGIDLLNHSLLPAIVHLVEDSKWRVRLAIIEHIPMLAKQVGTVYFNDKITRLCLGWLGDEVYSIRRAASENLLQLSNQFGEKWVLEYVLPYVETLISHANYLHRIAAVYGLQILMGTLSGDTLTNVIAPLLLNASNDPVPNVRFTVIKTLQMLNKLIPPNNTSTKAEISSVLNSFVSDRDKDVRYYAKLALYD